MSVMKTEVLHSQAGNWGNASALTVSLGGCGSSWDLNFLDLQAALNTPAWEKLVVINSVPPGGGGDDAEIIF